MGKIKNEDISVVVQGAIHPEWTPLVLKSIRKSLPGARVILSTWEGTDISKLDYDVLVLNLFNHSWIKKGCYKVCRQNKKYLHD